VSAGYAIDLHTHSLRSDGALAPAELVKRAAARGVTIQALSDHDTLSGVAEAVAEGSRLGVRVIPATELNTESEWGHVHVLAYFVDPNDAPFEERMKWLRENRVNRIEKMVENLNPEKSLEISQPSYYPVHHVFPTQQIDFNCFKRNICCISSFIYLLIFEENIPRIEEFVTPDCN